MREIPVVFSDERHVEVQWRTLDGWRVEDLGRLARPLSHGWTTASKPLAHWSNASAAPLEFARA
jgi:hypothetical protein